MMSVKVIARVYYCFHIYRTIYGSLQQMAIKISSLEYLHFEKLQSNSFTESIPKISTD